MKILNSIEAVSQFKIQTKRRSDRGLWHIAAHHAAFLAGAIAKLQLILRRLPILARQGVACFAPTPNF